MSVLGCRPFAAVAALAATVVLAACAAASLGAQSPPTRYYVLEAVPSKGVPAGGGPAAGVALVALAKHLDHRRIATLEGPNQLTLADFDQWAAPLDRHMTAVLSEDLGAQIPSERVLGLPVSVGVPLNYRVETQVARFERTPDGNVVLIANWSVFDGDGRKELAFGRASYTQPAPVTAELGAGGILRLSPQDYAVVVSAMGRALADLSAEIASAIRRLESARPSRGAGAGT